MASICLILASDSMNENKLNRYKMYSLFGSPWTNDDNGTEHIEKENLPALYVHKGKNAGLLYARLFAWCHMSKWAHGKFFWNREKVHTWKRAAAAVQAFYFLAVWHETSNERPCHCRRWSSSCTSRRWTSRHGTGTKVEDQMVRRGLKEKFEIKTRQNRCMLTLFSGVPVSWGKVCRVLRPLPNH